MTIRVQHVDGRQLAQVTADWIPRAGETIRLFVPVEGAKVFHITHVHHEYSGSGLQSYITVQDAP